MKRILALVLALACALQSPAAVVVIDPYRFAVVSGCTTVHAENTLAHSDYIEVGQSSSDYYAGQHQYAPGANISVCAVEFVVTAVGTISGNTYTCQIWTESGSALGVLQGTSTGVAGSNSWSLTTVRFSFSSAVSLASGTNYTIVLTKSATESGSNYLRISRSSSGGLGGLSAWFTSAGTRSSFGTGDCRIKIYKQ